MSGPRDAFTRDLLPDLAAQLADGATSPADLGPCAGCGHLTIRYGEQGSPLCPTCKDQTGPYGFTRQTLTHARNVRWSGEA